MHWDMDLGLTYREDGTEIIQIGEIWKRWTVQEKRGKPQPERWRKTK